MQMHTQLGWLGLLPLCMAHSSPNSMSSLLSPYSPLHGSLFYTHFYSLSSLLLPHVYLQSLHSFPHSLLLPILTPLSTCSPLHSLLSSKLPFSFPPPSPPATFLLALARRECHQHQSPNGARVWPVTLEALQHSWKRSPAAACAPMWLEMAA